MSEAKKEQFERETRELFQTKWNNDFFDSDFSNQFDPEKILEFVNVRTRLAYEQGRKEERERIERVVEDFDVVNDTMGNPVKNPLMHVRDVKNLIISRLKEQPHEHK